MANWGYAPAPGEKARVALEASYDMGRAPGDFLVQRDYVCPGDTPPLQSPLSHRPECAARRSGAG